MATDRLRLRVETAFLKPFIFAALAACSLTASGAVRPASAGVGEQAEQHERQVDAAALGAQDKAISKLTGLLGKYRGTSQEPMLLEKLAELQQQDASLHFRLAHGTSQKKRSSVDLSQYRRAMKDSIATLSRLITVYPGAPSIAAAYFMRGKAYEEVEDKKAASRDFLYLVKTYPDSRETLVAYMSLAEFAIQDNDHPAAIRYLGEVEKHPDDAHYPFALYKLAWSHYNLKDIPRALSYVEKHVAYYDSSDGSSGDDTATSDIALKENSLLDATTFFMEGFEQGLPRYRVSEALVYFKKLDRGPVLGRMISSYAKLLRSHGHEAELMAWMGEVLRSEPNHPESIEVCLIAFEYLVNRREYSKLAGVTQALVALMERGKFKESLPKTQRLLLDTAENLQALIIRNKGAEGVAALSAALAGIYDAFTRIVDSKDPRIVGVHYNLAETLFEIKEFDKATTHYRWIVENFQKDQKTWQDAYLKAIASRYEALRSKGLIPGDLKAAAFSTEAHRTPDPVLAEWFTWLAGVEEGPSARAETESFRFEAARCRYQLGELHQATHALMKLALERPQSKYAIPAASLVLDTYSTSAEWEGMHGIARRLLGVPAWKDTEFGRHLGVVAADAAYQQLEKLYNEKNYAAALVQAEQFLTHYSDSARKGDALVVAGSSSLALGQPEAARKYFSRLVQEMPGSPSAGTALLSLAKLAEESYSYGAAAQDYQAYLTLPTANAKVSEDARRKILILSWLSGDPKRLQAAVSQSRVCTADLSKECDKYRALAQFPAEGEILAESDAESAFERARKSSSENKAIWAALALEGSKHLAYRDRNVAIRVVSQHWEELEPLVRYTLISRLSRSIPQTLALNRTNIHSVAPLRADERYLTRRMEVTHEYENAVAAAVNLPWASIRAQAMNQLAWIYFDLAAELKKLGGAGGDIARLVLPFEEKAQEIRAKAFDAASRSGIEASAFSQISQPYLKDNPSLAKKLGVRPSEASGIPFGVSMLRAFDWGDASPIAVRLKAQLARALESRLFAQAGYLLQEAQEKNLIAAGPLAVARAVSLARAGAQAEALAALGEARARLPDKLRIEADIVLVSHYMTTLARSKTQELLKEIIAAAPSLQPTTGESATVLTAARQWSGT